MTLLGRIFGRQSSIHKGLDALANTGDAIFLLTKNMRNTNWHSYDWKPYGEITNEVFGYPVLAAIGLYLTRGVMKKEI